MAVTTGSNNLTTYYAKRLIGDSNTTNIAKALLQLGSTTESSWILHSTKRGTTSYYGIKYLYDDQVDQNDNNTGHDKIELYGGYKISSINMPSAWVQLDTGDTHILGRVGIGYDPTVDDNTYKLYVNGSTYIFGPTYLYDQVGIGYDPENEDNVHKLYVNGTSWLNDHVYLAALKNIYMHYTNTTDDIDADYLILNNPGGGNIALNAASHGLYLGYINTDSIKLYYSTLVDGSTSQTEFFEVNSNGAYALTRFGVNGQSTDYNLYVNGSSYFTNTIYLPQGLKTGARVNGSGSGMEIGDDGGIELYHSSTPFIDFHYQASTSDYSVRLICDSATNLGCKGSFTATSNIYANGGYLKSTNNGNTVTIGSANTSWCHIENSSNIPFYFNKAIHVNGDIYYYNTKVHIGSSGFYPPKNGGIYWDPYVESTSDASDVTQIIQIASGVAGGTELRIQQANDSNDVINLVSPYYIYLNSKKAFAIYDSWLRINEDKGFSSGVYFGSSLVRTDNTLRAGTGSGSWTDITAGVVVARIDSGESRVEARNGTHRVYLYCNSDGRSGLYGVRTDGTSYSLLAFANNSSTGTFSGNCTGTAGGVAWANVSSKPATATRWPAWSEVTSKPSTFAPSSHSHTWASITSKPGATGGATTPVYWNGSGFTNCTAYASASVNYANSAARANYVQPASGNVTMVTGNGHVLALQTDCNLVIYKNGKQAVWSSGTSSRLIKEHINTINNEDLKNFMLLNPVSFDYKPEVRWSNVHKQLGLIAEEVLELYPGLVIIPEEFDIEQFDIKKGMNQPLIRLNYDGFIPLLIKMVQNQQNKIESLEHQINQLILKQKS